MSARLKLADAPGSSTRPRSPEREALASAIVKRNAAAARVQAIKAAQETADRNVLGARRAVEVAEQNIQSAKAAAARHLTDVAMGRDAAAPMSIRQARSALQDANDELEAAEAARAALGKETVEVRAAHASLDALNVHVQDVARAVVAADPLPRTMADRREKLWREVAELSAALDILGASVLGRPVSNCPPAFHDLKSPDQWRGAMKALETNPDAPLPDLPSLE